MVSNISSSVSLGFIDDELPPKGRNHNKTYFNLLYVFNMEMVPPVKEPKNAKFPMVFGKDARTMIEVGHPEGWGKSVNFPVNKDRFGLGYHSQPSIVKKTMPNIMEE